MKIKLSNAPGLPLAELRMPKPRTRTSLAPDRLPDMVRFYGLERRKRLAAGPACSRSNEGSTQMGNSSQLVETLHQRCRPTPVPRQTEEIQGRLDVRESRPTSIQTSSAMIERSAMPELRVRLSPLPLHWQASSEPKSTPSRTGDHHVNPQTDGELVFRSALGKDSWQQLSLIAAQATPVREEFVISVDSADALECHRPSKWIGARIGPRR